MKLVSYFAQNGADQLALLIGEKIFDVNLLDEELPDNMGDFLWEGQKAMSSIRKIDALIKAGEMQVDFGIPLNEVILLAPVPFPTSCRDAYAFRQHVEAARKNRGVEMIPEFDQFPIFYFTNHNSILGPGEVYCMPDHFKKLDFELEVAIVIGKEGRNIKAADADKYIAGYMIMNDLSARELQMEEMKLNLGPAKGKDFATTIGPYLVTSDELEQYKTNPKKGHVGNAYNLKMQCRVNGKLVSEGNMADMDWTFAEIIERCSYGTELLPGDVIGSGTVGTGCFLELNGTGLRTNPNYQPQWLQAGDAVEMEIDCLGKLSNTIVKDESQFSILALKKNL